VVEEVARTHHADEYEMKIEERPVKIMAPKMAFLESIGKFFAILADDQSSTTRDPINKTGIVNRLL